MKGRSIRIVAGMIFLCVLVVTFIYGFDRFRLSRESARVDVISGPMPDRFDDRHVFEAPGITTPAPSPAIEAGLKDQDEVIGVLVDGRARAYVLKEMEDRMRHIVNDVVGETPVTITYCNLNGCLRAFRGQPGGNPIAFSQAGLKGNRMVIRLDGVDYLQETASPLQPGSKPLSIPPLETTRTTWKAWREAHPETEVVRLVRKRF